MIQTPFEFISGLADCHLPGLYSLVVRDRVSPLEGMKRVFYCGPECRMDLWEGADFRLKPHNHRQNIRLSKLFGDVNNVEIKFDRWGEYRLWRYGFGSGLLNGKFSLHRMWSEDASVISRPLTMDGVSLHWSEVHTVAAQPESAWLVEEGELATPGCERVWSVCPDLDMSIDGLYRPMSSAEVEDVGSHVIWFEKEKVNGNQRNNSEA